jgi:hypothetical protein
MLKVGLPEIFLVLIVLALFYGVYRLGYAAGRASTIKRD